VVVPRQPEIRQKSGDISLRELQAVLTMLPGLIKALPILVAYLVVVRFAIGQITGWRQPVAGQEMAYALAGIAAFLWAIGR
jgi:hypothetical protein